MTFYQFLEREKVGLKSRSLYDWYGSIVLTDLEKFQLQLVLFHSTNLQRSFGTTYCFLWNAEQHQLVSGPSDNTSGPILNGDHLKITIAVAGDPWFEGKGFSKISDELIEAFLNDAYREEILLAFNAPEKRVDLCRWFSENGLTIYRRLIHPNSADPILEEAVFPPKLDFKPYHDATGSNQ